MDVTTLTADERARRGLFLAFQYPEAIPGVSVIQFLRQAIAARTGVDDLSVLEVRLSLDEWIDRLGMDRAFAERHLNEGFSGGERKRNEILQLALLEPDVAILDETDSGLDIDALRAVARGVQAVRERRPAMAVVVVTHYAALLDAARPRPRPRAVGRADRGERRPRARRGDRRRRLRRGAGRGTMSRFDPERVRGDVPELRRTVHGRRWPTSTRRRRRSRRDR